MNYSGNNYTMMPVSEIGRSSHLLRVASSGNSCRTSISNSTYTSSVFSTEEDNYDSRIKEIEEYYIKTLLNEDESTQEDYPSEDSLVNSHSKLSDGYYQPLNDFKPKDFLGQSPALSKTQEMVYHAPNTFQPQALKVKPKRNPLEVEINRNLKPGNDILPLTTENLQRLNISADEPHPHSYASGHIHKTTQPSEQPTLNKGLYKTELCESFTTKGSCRYGNKCQFAHGLHEVKFKPKANNYRTKPCVNWTKYGYCPYGKRCCFKHGNDEDIQVYAGKSNCAGKDSGNANFVKKKNLHANVKALQKITW